MVRQSSQDISYAACPVMFQMTDPRSSMSYSDVPDEFRDALAGAVAVAEQPVEVNFELPDHDARPVVHLKDKSDRDCFQCEDAFSDTDCSDGFQLATELHDHINEELEERVKRLEDAHSDLIKVVSANQAVIDNMFDFLAAHHFVESIDNNHPSAIDLTYPSAEPALSSPANVFRIASVIRSRSHGQPRSEEELEKVYIHIHLTIFDERDSSDEPIFDLGFPVKASECLTLEAFLRSLSATADKIEEQEGVAIAPKVEARRGVLRCCNLELGAPDEEREICVDIYGLFAEQTYQVWFAKNVINGSRREYEASAVLESVLDQ